MLVERLGAGVSARAQREQKRKCEPAFHCRTLMWIWRTVERWNGGTVERWNGGTVERWNGGTVERWNGGTVERWNGGTVERVRLSRSNDWSRAEMMMLSVVATQNFSHARSCEAQTGARGR